MSVNAHVLKINDYVLNANLTALTTGNQISVPVPSRGKLVAYYAAATIATTLGAVLSFTQNLTSTSGLSTATACSSGTGTIASVRPPTSPVYVNEGDTLDANVAVSGTASVPVALTWVIRSY